MIPIFDFRCPVCGLQEERFIRRDTEVICITCSIAMIKMMPLVAKTSSLWNDSWNAGLDGQGIYSLALGKKVHNKREEEKILNAKGFISEKELGSHWWDDQTAKQQAKIAEQDRLTEAYNSKVKEYGGDKIKAMTETFTTEACLDGSLHKTFDEKITI